MLSPGVFFSLLATYSIASAQLDYRPDKWWFPILAKIMKRTGHINIKWQVKKLSEIGSTVRLKISGSAPYDEILEMQLWQPKTSMFWFLYSWASLGFQYTSCCFETASLLTGWISLCIPSLGQLSHSQRSNYFCGAKCFETKAGLADTCLPCFLQCWGDIKLAMVYILISANMFYKNICTTIILHFLRLWILTMVPFISGK
jgi:hypothetical protein